MTTVPLRPSNPVVAPHTSSTNGARMGSGMWTVKAVSARSGRQATVPVTISTGLWRMAASLVLDHRALDRGSVFVGRYRCEDACDV